MKKLVVLVSMAAMVAVLVAGLMGAFGTGDTPAVYASRVAEGIEGAGKSGVNVQNLDPDQPALVNADFYNQRGGGPVQISLPPVAALAAHNIYLPNESALENGAYAAIISADRQIAAIARTEWEQSGGAALYSNVAPGNDVAIPLATKGYFGQNSVFSIQNTDPGSSMQAMVHVIEKGSTTPLVSVPLDINGGTSRTVDLATDPRFTAVPNGFLGAIRVESESNKVGVQSFIDYSNSEKAVYAFEGVPVEMAADTLFAPLVRNNFFGTTGISVVNPGTTAVDVTVTYSGSPDFGSCKNQSYTQSASIAAGDSQVFYQGGNVPGATANPLPAGCLASAKIEATGGNIQAVINDLLFAPDGSPGTSAAYNGVSEATAALKVALPLYRNKHTNHQLTTGIQAMNISGTAANVTIRFSPVGGTTTTDTKTIAPGSSFTWYPPDITSLATGVYGGAFVESDQKLAVIVNDASLAGTFDAAIYNGINADVQ